MSTLDESLDSLETHWSVAGIRPDDRERIRRSANRVLTEATLEMTLAKVSMPIISPEDYQEIYELGTAYELAFIDTLARSMGPVSGERTREKMGTAAASQAFELLRSAKVPEEVSSRRYRVLELGALAYCGERWTDMKHWIGLHEVTLADTELGSKRWDTRVMASLYKSWVLLFQLSSWDEVSQIGVLVQNLHEEQSVYEAGMLDSLPCDTDCIRSRALHLVALYNWTRATELLAKYILNGPEGGEIDSLLDKHFGEAIEAAFSSGDASLEVLLHLLQAAAHKAVDGSPWQLARFGSDIKDFVSRSARAGLLELLPPQSDALFSLGLLNPASLAFVVDLPTSGGKTLLAEFSIVQTTSLFRRSQGWIAYVAPTRALVNQLTRRLRRDLGSSCHVEQLSGAIDIDSFETELLESADSQNAFDVLVCTPEKLSLVLRNRRVKRPLSLVIVDEAHNLEDTQRGLGLELLLTTIIMDYPDTHFLLLTPEVPNAQDLARWLDPKKGRSISLSAGPWRPNDRLVGAFGVEGTESSWHLTLRTLVAPRKALDLQGETLAFAETNPLSAQYKKVKKTRYLMTAAMARVMSADGCSVAVSKDIPTCWMMARALSESMDNSRPVDPDLELAARFIADETSPDFELVNELRHGVGVHHAGLSDEVRGLVEWLAERDKLAVVCATTTLAQGVDFSFSSVFLSSTRRYNSSRKLSDRNTQMSSREFWNLAGRAGRVGRNQIGVVGVAEVRQHEADAVIAGNARALASTLESMLDDLQSRNQLATLSKHIDEPQWDDFRSYIAHLMTESNSIDKGAATAKSVLSRTFGYRSLADSEKPEKQAEARELMQVTQDYIDKVSSDPNLNAALNLCDSTGFSPEGVRAALAQCGQMGSPLDHNHLLSENFFSQDEQPTLSALFGVMLHVPQLSRALAGLVGRSDDPSAKLSRLARDWVNGARLSDIAQSYFPNMRDLTASLTKACKGVYRELSYAGTWGLSTITGLALAKAGGPPLSESQEATLRQVPAMLYYGVGTPEAILMRMNGVPRVAAPGLAAQFLHAGPSTGNDSAILRARGFLLELGASDWQKSLPPGSVMTGQDCRKVWQILSGHECDMPSDSI